MRGAGGADEFYHPDTAGVIEKGVEKAQRKGRIESGGSGGRSACLRNEPAAAEEESWAERRKENWLALGSRLRCGGLQNGVKRGGTGGRAEIPGVARNGRKFFQRHATLLGEQGDESRVRLMRGEASHSRAGNTAAELDGVENFFEARDGRAGEGLAVEVHIEAASRSIIDSNGRGILPGAAEEEFA